VKKLW